LFYGDFLSRESVVQMARFVTLWYYIEWFFRRKSADRTSKIHNRFEFFFTFRTNVICPLIAVSYYYIVYLSCEKHYNILKYQYKSTVQLWACLWYYTRHGWPELGTYIQYVTSKVQKRIPSVHIINHGPRVK